MNAMPRHAPVDLDLVKATLAERLDSLVPRLFPAAVLDGHHWRLGSIDGAPGQSLAITRTGANAGLWKDFGGTARGSALDLIAHALFAGRVDADVVRWAVEWCQLGGMSAADQRLASQRAAEARAKAEAAQAEEAAKKSQQAKAIWLDGAPIVGTPAEAYLAHRAIPLARMGRFPQALRYGAAVYNAELQQHIPAMLAYIFDPLAGKMVAVHRTYLRHVDGAWVKDARLTDAKKSLGPFKGGHIPLWRGAHDGTLRELPAGTWIATAEGIENALSVAVQKPDLRCIAHISLDNLGGLKLPDNIGGLYIAADNDAPGSDAARGMERQLARLTERGIPHQLVRAPEGIKDMNDWLKACAAPTQTSCGGN